jgi:hypothetical protein
MCHTTDVARQEVNLGSLVEGEDSEEGVEGLERNMTRGSGQRCNEYLRGSSSRNDDLEAEVTGQVGMELPGTST